MLVIDLESGDHTFVSATPREAQRTENISACEGESHSEMHITDNPALSTTPRSVLGFRALVMTEKRDQEEPSKVESERMDSTKEPKLPNLSTDAPIYELETERLLFRRMLESDSESLHEVFSNHDAMAYW